jgi:3-methylcrotonyl-CoA carboxylase alpha subunit
MKLKRPGESRIFELEVVARQGATIRVRVDGEEIVAGVEASAGGGAIIRLDGRRIRVYGARTRNSILVAAGPAMFTFAAVEGRAAHGARGLVTPEIAAPMPGKVLKVLVAEGDAVAEGQPLVVLEAMKMETTLYAESPAIVKKIRAVVGAMVDHGAVLMELSPAPDSSKHEAPAQGG